MRSSCSSVGPVPAAADGAEAAAAGAVAEGNTFEEDIFSRRKRQLQIILFVRLS